MVATGCLQNFMMGGVVFGWATISSTLLVDEDRGVGLSDRLVHRMFVMASSANMCSPLALGLILDRFGPRACSVTSIFIETLGFLLFGLVSTMGMHESAFAVATVLIGFGGPGVQNSIIHLANLFPERKSTVTAVITGCFQLSFCIFYIFDQIWFWGGVDYEAIFTAYAAMCTVGLIASALLWPDKPFAFEEQIKNQSPGSQLRLKHKFDSSMMRFPSTFRKVPIAESTPLSVALPPVQEAPESLKNASLSRQVLSLPYVVATAFLTSASFWANFYIGSADLELKDEDYMSPHEQGDCMRLFTLITVCGVFGIPFVGYVMDHFGFATTLTVTVTLGLVWAICTMLYSKPMLIFSFVAYALFRTFTFNFFFAFLADKLGFRYFGILAGISFAVAGVCGFLQQPLLEWGHEPCNQVGATPDSCGHGNWVTIHWLKLGTFLLMYLLPASIYLVEEKPTGRRRTPASPAVKRSRSAMSTSQRYQAVPSGRDEESL